MLANNITAVTLAQTVASMNYAVVKGQGGDVILTNMNGKNVVSDKEWTVANYRSSHAGKDNAIIYVKDVDHLEIIVVLANGFCVHGISDLQNIGGRGYIEVAIKHNGRVVYNTPLTNSVIHKVSPSELSLVINHVRNLIGDGSEYRRGFTPSAKYIRRHALSEVVQWLQRVRK